MSHLIGLVLSLFLLAFGHTHLKSACNEVTHSSALGLWQQIHSLDYLSRRSAHNHHGKFGGLYVG